MSSSTADAVVIGAGVIGCSIANELARLGWRTVSVDRLPAAGYGPTSASSAVVRLSYSTEQGINMAAEGRRFWMDWANHIGVGDDRGLARYIETGMLVLIDDGAYPAAVRAQFDAVGVPYEVMDNDQVKQRFGFSMDRFGPPSRPDDPEFFEQPTSSLDGAVWTDWAGYINDPQLAAYNLQLSAQAAGAEFRFNTEVTDILRPGGRVAGVKLADGSEISSPVVINVGGPWSARLNVMAGLEGTMAINTRPLRHESHLVPAPAGFDYEAEGATVADTDNGIYFRPEAGNMILIGSTDPECDPREYLDDPAVYNEDVTTEAWQAATMRIAKRLPDLGIPHQRKGLVGIYDVSDDWIPVYDKTDLPGFYVAIGTSGNQFKNTGSAGRAMAQLVAAVEDGWDHDATPFTTTGTYTGLTLDMGFYSRNRGVNAESSMSVLG